ncbi:MAG: hypothetical protein QOE33_3298 [Acidobacteriota bacterium]|nr:hypothetical protein [Acidobacteriota bacterium]
MWSILGGFLSLAALVMVMISFFRVSIAFGAICIAMLVDVVAFLKLFIPTGSITVAIVAGLIFILLFFLLVREWKKVAGL